MEKPMQRLLSHMRACMEQYDMIQSGDRVAVAVSGGKDSLVLLAAMARLRQFYPKPFAVQAVTIDPQFGGEPGDYSAIEALCQQLEVPYTVKRTQLWEIIFEVRKESNPCSLCARMRRGALHDLAKELGCNKIALGHHMDDAVETFYMNLWNNGRAESFAPLTYLSRKDLYMIRPMLFATEREVQGVANKLQLPVVKSRCPADGVTEREGVKQLLRSLMQQYPDLREKTLGALQRGDISGFGTTPKA